MRNANPYDGQGTSANNTLIPKKAKHTMAIAKFHRWTKSQGYLLKDDFAKPNKNSKFLQKPKFHTRVYSNHQHFATRRMKGSKSSTFKRVAEEGSDLPTSLRRETKLERRLRAKRGEKSHFTFGLHNKHKSLNINLQKYSAHPLLQRSQNLIKKETLSDKSDKL